MSLIKPGDSVTFTVQTSKGRTVSLTLKKGKVESIANDMATVLIGKKSRYSISVSNLRLVGQKSTLTEFAETIFGHEIGA